MASKKRGNALISIIIAISIIGILAAAVMFSSGDNVRLQTYQVALQADLKTIQTAVDAYYLEHLVYPSQGSQPSLGLPRSIDWNRLVPGYLLQEPKLDLYYWIDHHGQVWMAAYDAPTDLNVVGNTLQWKFNDGPSGFEIFQKVSSVQVANASPHLMSIAKVDVSDIEIRDNIAVLMFEEPIDPNGQYYISAHGPLGITPPVGFAYDGHPFPPVTDWSWAFNFNKKSLDTVKPDPAWNTSIAVGFRHSLAVKADGTVRSWGNNEHGQLGDGSTIHRPTPVRVQDLTDVVNIAGGYRHSLALRSDGTVWAWGYNAYGQLGDGSTTDRPTPVQVQSLMGVVAVTGGGFHSIALDADGTVWTWGMNSDGQLGDGSTTTRRTPVQVQNLTDVVAVAGGEYHSLALKSDGTVWAWGRNNGQLGDGSVTTRRTPVQVQNLTDVVAVAAGEQHSLALKADGTVWAWGRNYHGQLGDGSTTDRRTPVQVQNLTDVVAVAAGRWHSFALKADGTAWAWGYNAYGQLGDGSTADRHTPVQVQGLSDLVVVAAGRDHSLALKADGTVWSWGGNSHGQLGDGVATGRAIPAQMEEL